LNLILKTDVQGSLEALKNSLFKIKSDKVQVNIINGQVGEVSESDIQLASASKAVIIGFHTQIESHAEFLIKQLKVEIKLFDIIYHIVDEVKKLMIARLDKIPEENDSGSAKILTIFKASHIGNIAGCQVTSGTIHRNDYVRVIRKDELIWKGKIASLKRIKEDVKEVTKGTECGIVFENFIEIEVDDVVQAYKITYHTQEL
jgi:translation initiation factor IF-2